MRVRLSTPLTCRFEDAVEQVKTPRLLEHVAHPLVRFTPASSTTPLPGQWSESTYWVRLTLFGFIPFGKQAVRITFHEQPDRFQVRDNGYSRLIRRWDHWVTIEPSGDGCHYEDCIDVEAGVLTPVIWLFARIFYAHRQARWRKLAASGFQYPGD